MNTFKKFSLAAGLCAAGAMAAPTAFAQTTDGFHTVQMFPVVVDSASFTQRFTFRNRNASAIQVVVAYFPGGGAQTTAISCNDVTVAAGADRTYPTLRDICPSLAAGSEFGFLFMYEGSSTTNLPFSAFSRVANPQGNGFSVEAFAAKEFTSAPSTVAGIRRMAAGPSNPAFQTNCFFAAMNDYSGPANGTSDVSVVLRDSAGVLIGSPTALSLVPGKLTRLSDVFATVGAPAGDYVDARMTVSGTNFNRSGVMSFCTVQDNTSFGADFRIAKQEINQTGQGPSTVAAQSDYVSRQTSGGDVPTSGGTRVLQTANSILTSTTHVVYFHHPDFVKCALLNNLGVQATAAYGLEMRLLANDGTTVLAGGNNAVGWGFTYLGNDKGDYNTGADGRYTIEVEDNQDSGGAVASVRPYTIKCESGSGSTLGEIVRYQEAFDRF